MFWLGLAISSSACALPETEIRRQLVLGYEQFDMVPGNYGWRQLNGRGCTDTAVALLRRYFWAQRNRLSPAQRSEVLFHQGQAFAIAGRNSEAIAPLKAALAIGGTEEWKTYLSGNLAFIRHDLPALRNARNHYHMIAPGSDRLKFLDGFLACPAKPYMAAAFCAR